MGKNWASLGVEAGMEVQATPQVKIQVCHVGGADRTADAAGTEDACWDGPEDVVQPCDTGMGHLAGDNQDSVQDFDEGYYPVMEVPGLHKAGDLTGVKVYPSVDQSVGVLAHLHHIGPQCCSLDPESVLEEPDCEGVLAPAFPAGFVTLD